MSLLFHKKKDICQFDNDPDLNFNNKCHRITVFPPGELGLVDFLKVRNYFTNFLNENQENILVGDTFTACCRITFFQGDTLTVY